MLKLAPILEEVPEDICMSGHEGSRGHDRKLHQALPFHVGGGIGPESITRKSEMANHNSRVPYIEPPNSTVTEELQRNTTRLIELAQYDWNSLEEAPGFQISPFA